MHYIFTGNNSNLTESDQMDYLAPNSSLAQNGSTKYTFTITIVNDSRLETNECFRVRVIQPKLPDNITLPTNCNVITDIIIMDDDGTYIS